MEEGYVAEAVEFRPDPAVVEITGSPATLTVTRVQRAESAQSTIERRLSDQPIDIRDAARVLSREFTAQVEELKSSKPNDPDRLVEHNGLVAFLERMAAGLADLADALDRAISGASDGKPEPAFLGSAGKIAEQLHLGLMEWLDANRTFAVEVPIRIALFGAGVAFLHSIAADGIPAIAALTTLVLKRGPKPKRARKEKRPK